ncbi:MAG: hypothetical protein KF756_05485 [Acidobacteria bacterium]|nr:hypothetical protein [Acidobacteriota bacterium]
MIRLIIAIVIGFTVWTIIWLGSEQMLSNFSPGWWGEHQTAFEKATINRTPFTVETSILLVNLFRGAVTTIISGFIAALIAGERKRSTLVLGILLLAFGLFVVAMTWSMIPLWYHVLFSAMLIPLTMLGGRLRREA